MAKAGLTKSRQAAELSKKQGNRKTMHFVRRIKRDGAAVSIDEYEPLGSYAGEWREDMRHGFGAQTYKNGDMYEGTWINDRPEGNGTLWKHGSLGKLCKVYEGQFVNGKKHGQGRYYFENGDTYEGSFVYDKREGRGMMRYATGDTYSGEWANDAREGRGTLTLAKGDSYTGAWSHDKKHGAGRYFYLSGGLVHIGEWVDDIAKCGAMSPFSSLSGPRRLSLTATNIPITTVSSCNLPPLQLENPDNVVQQATQTARELVVAQDQRMSRPVISSLPQHTLYDVNPGEYDLVQDELLQLSEAFQVVDTAAEGYIPADANALHSILTALGIPASMEDAHGLLLELVEMERSNSELESQPEQDLPGITFRVFASCMARLRE